MLNDVHIPPLEEPATNQHFNVVRAAITDKSDVNTSHVRDRLPTAIRGDAPEAIYGEPEDRGDSFNTIMSASVVLIVVVVVAGIACAMFL